MSVVTLPNVKKWGMRLSETPRIDVSKFESAGFSKYLAGFASGVIRSQSALDRARADGLPEKHRSLTLKRSELLREAGGKVRGKVKRYQVGHRHPDDSRFVAVDINFAFSGSGDEAEVLVEIIYVGPKE